MKLMGYPQVSFPSKAVHLVSDFTSVILNPIFDPPPTEDEEATKNSESTENEYEKISDGPDTSSFMAFLVSLLSSTEPIGHSSQMDKGKAQKEDTFPDSERKGYNVRKSCKFEQNTETWGEYELVAINNMKETSLEVVLPDISEPSLLLSESLRYSLYLSLPIQDKERKWVLLYSTWKHGISLLTLYRRSMLCPGHNLLIVGDQQGAIFGGLVDAPLRPTTKKKYQGTNSTFVFSSLSSSPFIFRPTGTNRYFTLCSTEYLALGGGGHFALYLQEDLLSGSSSASDTFGNPCLAHTQDFSIKEVELWGFVHASKYEEALESSRLEVPGICRW